MLALKSVNLETNVGQHSLAMNADCVHRDAVFANLNAAMTEAGYSSANILQESAALDAAILSGQGFVTMEHDGYIYHPDNTQFNFNSQEEQTLFQQFLVIFRQLKNCVGETFELLRGINLWEQLNALLLASGLVGFATQCVNLGRAAGNCAVITAGQLSSIAAYAGNTTLNGIRYLTNNIFRTNTADKPAHTRDDNDDDDDDETKKVVKNILEGLTFKISQQQMTNKRINKSETFYSIMQNKLDPIILQLLKDNPPVFPRDLKKYRIVSESQISDVGYDSTGGRRKSKKTRTKSKRRRTKSRSSKKRRHYKTKKRVYRSTRFRTHR
jgi:hypothetical protein